MIRVTSMIATVVLVLGMTCLTSSCSGKKKHVSTGSAEATVQSGGGKKTITYGNVVGVASSDFGIRIYFTREPLSPAALDEMARNGILRANGLQIIEFTPNFVGQVGEGPSPAESHVRHEYPNGSTDHIFYPNEFGKEWSAELVEAEDGSLWCKGWVKRNDLSLTCNVKLVICAMSEAVWGKK